MRVIALIADPAVIERILSWLGLWAPTRPGGASPPAGRSGLPPAYHPVPDIASGCRSGTRSPRLSRTCEAISYHSFTSLWP